MYIFYRCGGCIFKCTAWRYMYSFEWNCALIKSNSIMCCKMTLISSSYPWWRINQSTNHSINLALLLIFMLIILCYFSVLSFSFLNLAFSAPTKSLKFFFHWNLHYITYILIHFVWSFYYFDLPLWHILFLIIRALVSLMSMAFCYSSSGSLFIKVGFILIETNYNIPCH